MRRVVVGLFAVAVLATGCTSSGRAKPAGSGTPTAASSAPGGSAPSTLSSGPSSAASTGKLPQARVAPKLTGFRITDLTWIGAQGWALGSAACLGGTGRCDAIEHTTDGGRSWASLPAPIAGPGDSATACAKLCVAGLRFATSKIGYAFAGPGTGGGSAFFMTTDGGRTWPRQAGGAVALESLNGNVIRVVTTSRGCPPGCAYAVQTAPVGSTNWRTVRLPGRQNAGVGAQFGRARHYAYLESFGHVAGGAPNATAVLWTSRDDGAHWTNRGEPCPQRGGENDNHLLSVAPSGAAAVVCVIRGASQLQTLITSGNGGRSFRVPARDGLGSSGAYALGAASGRRVVVSSGDATYRTADAGATFQRVGAPAQLTSVAFGSSSVGHAVSKDRRSIWTTTDGGRTWTQHRFP